MVARGSLRAVVGFPQLVLVALATFGGIAGCSLVRDDAATLLAHARYPDALERLVDEEPAARRYGPRDRARYAVIRGLTHLALGDQRATNAWLGEAKAAFDRDPHCLSDDDAGRLLDAWASLGRGR